MSWVRAFTRRPAPVRYFFSAHSALAQAPFYIAIANGYFDKEGVTVEATNVRSALDAIAPLATGQLDVSFGAATCVHSDPNSTLPSNERIAAIRRFVEPCNSGHFLELKET